MTTNQAEAPMLDTGGGGTPGQVTMIPVPGKCSTYLSSAPLKEPFGGPPLTPRTLPMVVTRVTSTWSGGAGGKPQVSKPVWSQVTSGSQTFPQGRTVVITVPRSAGPQPVAVPPRSPKTNAMPLPASIQIPPGMMLIRSDNGQLMLVAQQALRAGCGPPARAQPPQVSTSSRSLEKLALIRTSTPSRLQPAPVQGSTVVIGATPKPAVVQTVRAVSHLEPKRDPPRTFTQETLDSVKKCKNFLVTLMKLASSDSKSTTMATSVRVLVRRLLEGELEAEDFTEELYRELKSTPQPCLVPFLKKSLPAVRQLTADPQLFIRQASTCSRPPSGMQGAVNGGPSLWSRQQPRTPLIPDSMTTAPSRMLLSRSVRPTSGRRHGTASVRPAATQMTSAAFREDDDINDVASMAGVNLREEHARILTGSVGSVVQSCQDEPFLSSVPVLTLILHTGQALGVTDVHPDVVSLVSHATQERLRGLLEKLTVMAELRKTPLKDDRWCSKTNDVRSQLRFLEDVDSLRKKRSDEEERERLLQLVTRSRCHSEDPEHQLLKQRARELQQLEAAQQQHRDANLTALAAIGPWKRRAAVPADAKVCVRPRPALHTMTRVLLRDLLVLMENDWFVRRSLTLYRGLL